MLGKALAAAAKAVEPAYVEDVFQTWLYTGNGSTQTITNGVDLAGKGGLVWTKNRNAGGNHTLIDTVRGTNKYLMSDSTNAENSSYSNILTAFNSNGYTLGADQTVGNVNYSSAYTYASWTFRKQAKFFDVVTFNYTSGSIRVPHSLGSVPGCIIVKYVGGTSDWYVYHRSRGRNYYSRLNSSLAEINVSNVWDTTDPTSTDFGMSDYLLTAGTWVAYVFAHDAGGFGSSGSDSVIKCGTYTGNGSSSGPQVDLSWEPQWIMLKRTSGAAGWYIYDNMRGVATGGIDSNLRPDSSSAENQSFDYLDFNATGFKLTTTSSDHNGNGDTYIYIAIRRGPMKTPTDATKVFSQVARTGTGSAVTITGTGFAPDALIYKSRSNAVAPSWQTRLQGGSPRLASSSTAAESADNELDFGATMDGIGVLTGDGVINLSSWTYINYFLRRAPGFFDVVAYGPGSGTTLTVDHNLGVLPELVILKSRSSGGQWIIQNGSTNYGFFNANAFNAGSYFTTLTSTAFSLTVDANTYIAYLFATCPGVSKVGTYTGTGTTLSVDCGFTAGARFVLIKRTDSTGDWYVWDTARGIVSGNDPFLLLNSTAAEDTSTDYIDPLNSGFQISSTAPAAINANGGTFIYLAVA